MKEDELYSVKEVARIFGVTPHAVRKAIKERRLTAMKHGRDWLIKSADIKTAEIGNK